MTDKVRKTFTPSTLHSIEKIVRIEFHNALHDFGKLNDEFHQLVRRQTQVKRAIGSLIDITRGGIEDGIVRETMEEKLSQFHCEARTNSERITELETSMSVATARKYTASIALTEMENATKNI